MTDDEYILNGYAGKIGASVSTAKDFSYVKFEIGDAFYDSMTDGREIEDGRTIGQANQDWLHDKLNTWIEENLKGKK